MSTASVSGGDVVTLPTCRGNGRDGARGGRRSTLSSRASAAGVRRARCLGIPGTLWHNLHGCNHGRAGSRHLSAHILFRRHLQLRHVATFRQR